MATNNTRIVISTDGTWNNQEDGQPTNALRIARAIQPLTGRE